jgi:hypothetical protein
MVAAYFPVGIQGFGRQEVRTRAGNSKLLAQTTVKNFNAITGRFDIAAPSASPSIKVWLEVADDVSYEILDIISFAEGRMIRWTVRYLVVEKYVRVMSFRGPRRTAGRQRGYHHWLDLQPVLELAARSYTPELKIRTGIDVALEGSLMNPRYLELDFVACMTALEHLAKVYGERNSKAVSPGREFFESEIEPILLKQLAALETDDLPADAASALKKATGKIKELVRPTLQDSLIHMLKGYGVPMAGLENVFPELIKLRNDIVHRGVARERQERVIRQEIERVRELLTRIFLRLLDYSGLYDSYLTGKQETVALTPIEAT